MSEPTSDRHSATNQAGLPERGGLARRSLLASAAAVPVAAATTVAGPASPAHAAPPNLTITMEPVDGGAARFLRLAPPTSAGSETAKVIFRLTIRNNSAATVTVTGIQFSFPGSGVPNQVMQGVKEAFDGDDNTIAPGASKFWSNGKVEVDNVMLDNAVYLAMPAPGYVRVLVTCSGFSSPATSPLLSLDPYVCPNPGGNPMPFDISDMRVSEVVVASGSHWANGGPPGTQIYAHDVGVEGWDELRGVWSHLLPDGDSSKNEHYRIWNKPVRAVADGVVVAVSDGLPDNTVAGKFPDPAPSPGNGNNVWIKHGTEYINYTHLRNGSIPNSLVNGTTVAKGQIIGRIGNSGRSSGPHIHLEVRRAPGWALRPWVQGSAWMVAKSGNTPVDPDAAGWLPAAGRGIPPTAMLIWPAASKPTWYPPGKKEITVYGVELAEYQTIFNRVTGSGYRLVWFDGYEVGTKNYVNAIFRPVGRFGWVARHGMSLAQFNSELTRYRNEGIRPVNVSSYMVAGTSLVQYALCGAYLGGPDWLAYGGKSAGSHQNLFEFYTALGYAPLNISITSPLNTPQFSALFVKQSIGGYVAASWLTPGEYQQQWSDNYAQGRYLFYLSACQHVGQPMFSAIFATDPGGTGGTVGKHHLDRYGIQSNLIKYTDSGLLTRCLAGYQRNGVANFAAGWRNG